MARRPLTDVVGPAAASTPSKSQRAYAWIRERITSQEFTPGYRLVLSALADDLGMSVVPVREAIRQLEAEGLVTFKRNVGAHVSMVDDSQYRHSMQTLAVLEGAATALSARRLTADDVRRARDVNAQMIEALGQFDPPSSAAGTSPGTPTWQSRAAGRPRSPATGSSGTGTASSSSLPPSSGWWSTRRPPRWARTR